MLKLIREIEPIETVQELLDALQGVDPSTPICDGVGEPLIVNFYEDMETGDPSIEIG